MKAKTEQIIKKLNLSMLPDFYRNLAHQNHFTNPVAYF